MTQLTIYNILLETADAVTPAQEYYIETGKTTYWQDSQGKPYGWWRLAFIDEERWS